MPRESELIDTLPNDALAELDGLEWKKPLPLDVEVDLPPFPLHCLPSVLRNYVEAVAEATQTPVDMAASGCLAVVAACIQGKYKIMPKPDWLEPLNLYMVLVAQPAERKSSIIALLTKYIQEYEQKTNEELRPEIDKSRLEKDLLERECENLKTGVAKGKADRTELMQKQEELSEFEEIRPIRYMADDATPEALTSLLADNNGTMAVISAEGGVFGQMAGKCNNTGINIDCYLKAHCGDTIRVDRKGRKSEYIKNPALTMLIAIQPQILDGLMDNETLRGRGLTGRFLYVMPKSLMGQRKYYTDAIPEECKEAYKELCQSLLEITQNDCGIIELSEEADKLNAEFASYMEQLLIGDLESIQSFAGKFHGAVLRIAGLLHITKKYVFGETELLSSETMQEAICIGNYFLEHAKAAFQLMGADESTSDAKYVLKQIEKRATEPELTKNEIYRSCRGRFKKADDILPALDILAEYGYIRTSPNEYNSVGRPSPKYELNPLHFAMF